MKEKIDKKARKLMKQRIKEEKEKLGMAIEPVDAGTRGFQTRWMRMRISNSTHGCTAPAPAICRCGYGFRISPTDEPAPYINSGPDNL